MEYLAYLSWLFLGMQLSNVLINVLFQQKIKSGEIKGNDRISVLIPARNEEKHMAHLLNDLQRSLYPNLEIIVFDDESTDHTAQIVTEFASYDSRISLLRSRGLSPGWLGKNHACYQLAQKATGKYLLFLDVDVRIESCVIPDIVAYLRRNQLELLSVFPIQILKTRGEKLSVPVMNYILLTLLPLVFVRYSPFSAHAAANGQFMLFDAATYNHIQPHRLFKSSAVEDLAIASYYKKKRLKMACVTGEKRIQCRMYESYQEALQGFTKNVFMFFGNVPVFAFVFWIFAAMGFIPVWIALPHYFGYYLIVIGVILSLYSWLSRQTILQNLVLYVPQMGFLLTILIKALWSKQQKTLQWKERNIYW